MKKLVGLVLVVVLSLSIVTANAFVLRTGSNGTEVRQLQTKLQELGYYKDNVDGKYLGATWKAVWWYQKDKGLKVDGIAGPQTLSSLGLISGTAVLGSGLKQGDKGSKVKALQTALYKVGEYKGNIDGSYGGATWKAVWWFQKNSGVDATGIADSRTLSLLAEKAGVDFNAPNSNYGMLQLGDSGATVRALQNALKNLGYYKGTVDGKYGDSTWAAVWQFQKDKNITYDGIAGTKTLALLNVSTSSGSSSLPSGKKLELGSSGDAVRTAQYALKKAGYYTGDIDGKYGDSTWAAVWWFQKNNGLAPDGVLGNATWNLLVK